MSDKTITIEEKKVGTTPTGDGTDPSVTEVLGILKGKKKRTKKRATKQDEKTDVKTDNKTGDKTGDKTDAKKPVSEAEYKEALKAATPALTAAGKLTKVSPTATNAVQAMASAVKAAKSAAEKKNYEEAVKQVAEAATQAKAASDERDTVKKAAVDEKARLDQALDAATKRAAKLTLQPKKLTDAVTTATNAQGVAKTAVEASDEDWPAAQGTLTTLDNEVKALEAVCASVSGYADARGKLTRKEAAVAKITDRRGNKKVLKEAYLAEVAKVKGDLDREDFDAALAKLPAMETALNKAFVERQREIEKGITDKISDISKAQDKAPGKKKAAYQDPGSNRWTKMVDKIVKLQLDPDFQENYDKLCDQVADDLANDPIVKDAKANWSTWMSNPAANKAKIETFMNQVVALQSARMGSDPPPVKTEKMARATTVGSFSTSKKDITLNSDNRGNKDFEELLDTLTHENTHAYQTFLIERLDGPVTLNDGTVAPRLMSGDPDYAAALVLKANDFPKGYIQSGDAKKYPGYSAQNNPYKKQACEDQAFRAGDRMGKAAYRKMNTGG